MTAAPASRAEDMSEWVMKREGNGIGRRCGRVVGLRRPGERMHEDGTKNGASRDDLCSPLELYCALLERTDNV